MKIDWWNTWKEEYRYVIIIGIVIAFAILGFFCYLYIGQVKPSSEQAVAVLTKTPEQTKKSTKIQVDIKGAIVNPGVYELDENSTVKDGIDKSGGLKENADTTYINLSKRLKDEMVIIIYTQEEIVAMKEGKENVVVVEGKCICPNVQNDGCIKEKDKIDNTGKTQDSTSNSTAIIDLNQATIEQLQMLTGIGEKKAKDIITYREEHGGFQSIEEITKVKGIGTATFEKIKDRITIS